MRKNEIYEERLQNFIIFSRFFSYLFAKQQIHLIFRIENPVFVFHSEDFELHAGACKWLKLQNMDARCYTNKLQDYYIILSRDKGGTSSRHDWFSGLEAVGRPLLLCTEHYALCTMQPPNHPSTPHNPNIKLQWDPRIDPMMRTCWLLKNSIFIGAS